MAKKQTSTKAAIKETVAPVVTPRATKPNTPRTRTAKHSKAISVEPVSVEPESIEEEPIAATGIEAGLVESDVFVADAMMAEAVEQVIAVAPESRHEAIAKLAYGYWAARGFQGGNPLEDWVRAEQEYGLV